MNELMKSKKWDEMMRMENKEFIFLIINIDEYIKDNTEFRELIILTIN
jgi:hypothetical protein